MSFLRTEDERKEDDGKKADRLLSPKNCKSAPFPLSDVASSLPNSVEDDDEFNEIFHSGPWVQVNTKLVALQTSCDSVET